MWHELRRCEVLDSNRLVQNQNGGAIGKRFYKLIISLSCRKRSIDYKNIFSDREESITNAMANGQTCYFPDGSKATSDTPCKRDPSSGSDGASACCNSADACLESHLCLEQLGGPMISRGSCTDQTWQSQECSQYCADGKTDLFCSFFESNQKGHYDLAMRIKRVETAHAD